MEGWQRSGLTQQRYCEQHDISVGSLRRWRQLFREEYEAGIAGNIAMTEQVRLVPVELLGDGGGESKPLILLLAEGMRIEIAPDFDAPTLQRLLGVLREAA